MSADLLVVGLGRMAYSAALDLQRTLAEARIDRTVDRDMLLLVEHPPVVTLGRSFQRKHLPTPPEELERRGIELFDIERGGDITFHGPGQLVGYPIFDLTEHKPDLHLFLRQIEECVIKTVADAGIRAEGREGRTGVWVEDRKLASIGIHVKKWVTWHGFALNVLTDLSFFDLIVPCGIDEVVMTSMQKELQERAPRDLWARTLDGIVLGFCDVFGQTPQAVTVADLKAVVGAGSME
ncbi:MAG: lipoyl(octanoyl) transferase LipB [Gemmatimonadetes bacterium]|nr:lipoyl(octanoyl) transferase LipB [Gemmatimonadota bacterium]